MAKPTELIIVCCHATYIGLRPEDCWQEENWSLQPFQRADTSARKPSEVITFAAHVRAAALLARVSSRALIMLSGGRTADPDRSEAESYSLAFSNLTEAAAIELEMYATDSYQNLLFSILRFRHVVGTYPEQVTIVTHAFKERRFLELHAPAIGWSRNRIRVQGINPPFSLEELEQTQRLEHERAYRLFVEDPYGAHSKLASKRAARNWKAELARELPVHDESVRQLLGWTGGETGREVFPASLPWSNSSPEATHSVVPTIPVSCKAVTAA